MSGVNMQEETAADPAKPKKKRKIFRWIFLFILLYPFLSIGLLYLIGPPKLIISKETTGIDNPPLTADGMVDYLKYFNDANSKGVTPENNFITAWVELYGDDILPSNVRAKYLSAIGLNPQEKYKGCFISEYKIAKNDEDSKKLNDAFDACIGKAWTLKEYPLLADYVTQNAKFLDGLKKAAKRTSYYYPLLSSSNPPVLSALLPALNSFRTAAKLLACRATLEAGKGNLDAAWRDVITIRQMGLKLHNGQKYSNLITLLVGIAVRKTSDCAAEAVLANKNLTAQQARVFRQEWNSFPSLPISSYDDIILGEKTLILDMIMWIQTANSADVDNFCKELSSTSDFLLSSRQMSAFVLQNIDMNVTFRRLNLIYNEITKALNEDANNIKSDQVEDIRQKLLDNRLKSMWADLSILWMPPNVQRKFVSFKIADLMTSICYPSFSYIRKILFAEITQYTLVNIGLALREYQLTKGGYPEKLAELVPGYFKELPKDPFSGKDYIYKQTKDGFKLYSIGKNFKDDGGVVIEDHPREGDIVLEIPIPEKSEKKK